MPRSDIGRLLLGKSALLGHLQTQWLTSRWLEICANSRAA